MQTEGHGPPSGRGPFTAAVTDALDDVFVDRGFLAGQGNDGPVGRNDVIFCIAMDDFIERWPSVFAALDARYGNDLFVAGGCIDCTIGGTFDGGITRFDLEAVAPHELDGVGNRSILQGFDTLALDGQLAAIRRWVERALPLATGG